MTEYSLFDELIAAVRKEDTTNVSLLLGQNAPTHLTDTGFRRPLNCAMSRKQYDIASMLIEKRTFFQDEDLQLWIRFLLLKWPEIKDNADAKNALIDYVASRLTGTDVNKLRSSKEGVAVWETYVAHLAEFKGSGRAQTDLEGWHLDQFLPLRIRAILQMIVERELLPDALSVAVKNTLRILRQEIRDELETLTIYQVIKLLNKSSAPSKMQSTLIDSLAKSIYGYLESDPTRELCVNVRCSGHAMYVNFVKNDNDIKIRIDNLGFGYNGIVYEKRVPRTFNCTHLEKDGKVYPYFLPPEKMKHLTVYLNQLIDISIRHFSREVNNVQTQIDFSTIYKQGKTPLELQNVAWAFPSQVVGNCVVAAHQVGLRVRLNDDELFNRFLLEELEILASLRECKKDENLERFAPKPDGTWHDLKQEGISDSMIQEIKDYYKNKVEQGAGLLTRLPLSEVNFNFAINFSDPNRWYRKEDIEFLLANVGGVNSDVEVSILDMAADTNYNSLELELRAWQEKKKKTHNSRRVIAINLTDLYYVLVMVKYNSNDKIILSYFDPSNQPISAEINDTLNKVYPSKAINKLECMQQNNCDSGPWIIAVASQFFTEKRFNLTKININEQRQLQSKLLQEYAQEQHKREGETSSTVLSASELVTVWTNCKATPGLWLDAPTGYGKSRFCEFVASQWVDDSNTLCDVKIGTHTLICVKLRHVVDLFDTEHEDADADPDPDPVFTCLAELLRRSIFSQTRSNKEPTRWWESEAIANTLMWEKITWLFDGYDELPEQQQRHFCNLLNKMNTNLAKHRYIITSRPHLQPVSAAIMINQIAPLSPDGIHDYSNKFFGSEKNKAEGLQLFLASRSSWQQLMVTPFNLELLCNIWLDKDIQQSSLQTLTDLYLRIFQLILKHAYSKEHNLPLQVNIRPETIEGHYKYAIQKMEKLAYHSMSNKKLCEESVDITVSDKDDIIAIGLVQNVDNTYEYIHKTLCEFMCARYIARNIHKDKTIQTFISQNKSDPFYGKVWPFIAGILYKMNKRHQPFFWHILLDYPFDLSGKYQIPLLINCLEESHVDANENIPSKAIMLSFLQKSFTKIFVNRHESDSFSSNVSEKIVAAFSSASYLLSIGIKDLLITSLRATDYKWNMLRELNLLVLDDLIFESLLSDIDDIMKNNWQNDMDRLSGYFQVLAKVRLSKNRVGCLIKKVDEWKEPLIQQPVFICMLAVILKKYAAIDPAAFELLLLFARGLLIPSFTIANMFALNCLSKLELFNPSQINEVNQLFIDLLRRYSERTLGEHMRNTLLPRSPSNKLGYLEIKFKYSWLHSLPRPEKFFISDCIKNFKERGDREDQLVDALIRWVSKQEPAVKAQECLDIKISKPNNHKKILKELRGFLHAHYCSDRLLCLKILDRRGYITLHNYSLLKYVMFMEKCDAAYVTVQGCAQGILRRVISKNNVSAFILDNHKDQEKQKQIIELFNYAFNKKPSNNSAKDIVPEKHLPTIIQQCTEHQQSAKKPHLLSPRPVERFSSQYSSYRQPVPELMPQISIKALLALNDLEFEKTITTSSSGSSFLNKLFLVDLVQIFLCKNHEKVLEEIASRLFSNRNSTYNNGVNLNGDNIYLCSDSLLVGDKRIELLPAHQPSVNALRQRFMQEIEKQLGLTGYETLLTAQPAGVMYAPYVYGLTSSFFMPVVPEPVKFENNPINSNNIIERFNY